MNRPPVIALILACTALWSTARAAPERDHHTVRSQGFGKWAAELRIEVGVRNGQNGITGLSCVVRGDDGVTLTLTRPVESGQFLAKFDFDIEKDEVRGDPELIERRIVSLGVGGRSYEFDRIQWRFSPVFLGWEAPPPETEILIATGIPLAAVRAGEGYPWLPVEYLIPALMEVETMRLGYRGNKAITPGEYQTVYRERTVRMDGFSQGMSWCSDAIRSEQSIKLPDKLKRRR